MRLSPEWLAGFFDGEGCVRSKYTSGGYLQVRCSISQKDREILETIQQQLGYGRIYSKVTCYSLEISKKAEVMHFIRLIYPHSVVKKRQLHVGYLLLQMRGLPTPRMVSLHERLSDLKVVAPVEPRRKRRAS